MQRDLGGGLHGLSYVPCWAIQQRMRAIQLWYLYCMPIVHMQCWDVQQRVFWHLAGCMSRLCFVRVWAVQQCMRGNLRWWMHRMPLLFRRILQQWMLWDLVWGVCGLHHVCCWKVRERLFWHLSRDLRGL